MKIAFLIGVNDVGGAEFVSYHHVLMAQRNKYEVVVLSGTTGKFHDLIKAAGAHIEVVGMAPSLEVVARLLKGADVVFNCNSFGITPTVLRLKPVIGFRYLTAIHSDIDWVYNQLVKYDKDTDGYYAIHQKIVDSFVNKGIMDRRKFRIVPNCVDLDRILAFSQKTGPSFSPNEQTVLRKEFGFDESDFVVGMVTRVAADKNILDAVKILSLLPDVLNARLLIIGGAPANPASAAYLDRVNRLVRTIGSGKFSRKVVITGNLPMEEVYQKMQAFDIGLNCSPSEGLPIALLEMMGAGIPCVMPGIGDIPEVLTGRGIVVPIRQRMDIKEILAVPCYSMDEIGLFVRDIVQLHGNRTELERLGNEAAGFVRKYRGIKFQEKKFIKFINMAKKTTEGKKVIRQENEVPGPGQNEKMEDSLSIVSVLMPVRDGKLEWIVEAIESIVGQDYDGEIELVIVNHDCRLGLSVNLKALVEKFTGQVGPDNFKFKLLEVKDDTLEFSGVLDFGIGHCAGDIIVRMDCDDIAEPGLVSKLVGFLADNKDIDVCGVQLQFFGAKSMVTCHPPLVTRKYAFEMPGTWFVNHPGVAIRKQALLKVGGYGQTKTGYAEDYHLWCKILKGNGTIANLPDVLMKYRCYHKEWRYPKGYDEFLSKEKAGLMVNI
jgi:glycosyltransferase involved in cell wall biosynthesis